MARYNRNTQEDAVNNEDMYVGVYDSPEAAEAGDREGLLTVQAFDQGDFPIMKLLDKENWEDGEIVTHTFVLRLHKRAEKPTAPKRTWSAKAAPAEAEQASETGESNSDLPY